MMAGRRDRSVGQEAQSARSATHGRRQVLRWAAAIGLSAALAGCYVSIGDGKVVVGNLPVIVTDPQSTAVREGEAAVFSVTAGGLGPIHYQWSRNGVEIPGAMSNVYITPPARLGDDGALFRVVVSNPVGSVESRAAALSVIPNP